MFCNVIGLLAVIQAGKQSRSFWRISRTVAQTLRCGVVQSFVPRYRSAGDDDSSRFSWNQTSAGCLHLCSHYQDQSLDLHICSDASGPLTSLNRNKQQHE